MLPSPSWLWTQPDIEKRNTEDKHTKLQYLMCKKQKYGRKPYRITVMIYLLTFAHKAISLSGKLFILQLFDVAIVNMSNGQEAKVENDKSILTAVDTTIACAC